PVVGKMSPDPVWRADQLAARQLADAPLDDADAAQPPEGEPQRTHTRGIDFDGGHRGRLLRDLAREHAQSRADLEHPVLCRQLELAHQAVQVIPVSQKGLTPLSLEPNTEPASHGPDGAGRGEVESLTRDRPAGEIAGRHWQRLPGLPPRVRFPAGRR